MEENKVVEVEMVIEKESKVKKILNGAKAFGKKAKPYVIGGVVTLVGATLLIAYGGKDAKPAAQKQNFLSDEDDSVEEVQYETADVYVEETTESEEV